MLNDSVAPCLSASVGATRELMPEAKTKCRECNAELLVATANRTGGVCMPCLQRANWQALQIQRAEDRQSWEAFHATLEPLPEFKEIPAEVRELMAERLQPNEVIDTGSHGSKEHWRVDEDLLHIFLIDRDFLKH